MDDAAVTRFDEGPQPDTDDAARLRGWRRRFVVVYGIAALTVVIAVAVGAVAGAHHHSGRPVHWWLIGIVAAVAVVAVSGGGFVTWRVQSRRGRTRELLAAGTWATNRRVGRALRKGRPVAPEDRRSAQAIVDLYTHRGWLVWFYAGLGVFWLALSFGYDGFQFGLHVALGALYLAFTPYWVTLRRRVLRHGAEQGLVPDSR